MGEKNNERFASYCPYCQIATSPSNPLPQGLREPPSYDFATSASPSSSPEDAPPPPYAPPAHRPDLPATDEKRSKEDASAVPPDTLHFLHPTEDTIPSLSLRYGVPAHVLRRHNHLASDHLVSARRTLLIPGTHYPSGVSLRPRPVEGEAEEARRAKIRRWMVGCKCADYEVAELYLAQAGYDLSRAVERYLADEAWEREHPMERPAGGKGKGRSTGGGTWASQAAFLRRQGPS